MMHTSHKSALQIPKGCIFTATGKQVYLGQKLDDENVAIQERGGERAHLRQNFTTFHSASCPVRSVWRRCWHLTTRSIEAPCLPPQNRHLLRPVPQFGTKTSQVQAAKEFWSSRISPAQRNFESLFQNTHYLCINLMPTMCIALLEHQVRSHLSRNATGSTQREQSAFVLKSHPQTIVTNPSFRYEKSKNCPLQFIIPKRELPVSQRTV